MRKTILSILAVMVAALAAAQVDPWGDLPDMDDFDKFRSQANAMLGNYRRQSDSLLRDYRDSINARFARQLREPWLPFEVQAGETRPSTPKPTTPPVAPSEPPATPVDKPQPLPMQPISFVDLYDIPVEPVRNLPPMPLPSFANRYDISFFNRVMHFTAPDRSILDGCTLKGTSENDVGELWDSFMSAGFDSCAAELQLAQSRQRLSDYALLLAVKDLTEQIWPGDENLCTAAAVFLLNQLEFDALMARTSNGELLLMVVIDGIIWDHSYIELNNKKYTIFQLHEMRDATIPKDVTIHTYPFTLPTAGLKCRMALTDSPRLPYKPASQQFEYTYAGMTYTYRANQNLMDFYDRYPPCDDLALYANTPVDSSFDAFATQLFSDMVAGKTPRQAVATILSFMHKLSYATDDDQFGFEKWFFCEENFFYPKNDCEDRSILFSWLVRRFTGLDVVLLEYPGHAATAVCFGEDEPEGQYSYYTVKGKRYVVCDPTYIGASIGEPQPKYAKMQAEVIPLRPVK